MRIWFLGDTHFGVKNDNDGWLADFYNYFTEVAIPTMKKEYKEGDILVHLGDVFDNRATVGLNTICFVLDIFNKLSEIFDDIRIVIGNHDIFNKSSNYITSVRVLEKFKNIKIYYDPEVEELGGKKILFNPWVNSLEDENNILSSVNVDYIFGHLDVNGCKLNASGIKSSSENAIDTKSFKKSLVFAGHIHKRQHYKNVYYVGSPYQMTRGDRDNSCGLSVLDLENGDVKFYENKYSPTFKKVSIYDIIDTTIGELKKEWNNSTVDLYITGRDILSCKFDELREELSGCIRELSLHQDNTEYLIETQTKSETDEDSDKEISKSVSEQVDEWLKDNDVTGKQYDDIVKMFNIYKDRLCD